MRAHTYKLSIYEGEHQHLEKQLKIAYSSDHKSNSVHIFDQTLVEIRMTGIWIELKQADVACREKLKSVECGYSSRFSALHKKQNE